MYEYSAPFKYMVPPLIGIIFSCKLNQPFFGRLIKPGPCWPAINFKAKEYLYTMTNFIPIFPLGVIVYPGEDLNLHIFEPRYKQLINECHSQKKAFGIPAVIDNKLQDHGTLVKITEISKLYDNGEMDIKTVGTEVFRILELIRKYRINYTAALL
jgi:hypothetical protein